jgi:hypothetical protein
MASWSYCFPVICRSAALAFAPPSNYVCDFFFCHIRMYHAIASRAARIACFSSALGAHASGPPVIDIQGCHVRISETFIRILEPDIEILESGIQILECDIEILECEHPTSSAVGRFSESEHPGI